MQIETIIAYLTQMNAGRYNGGELNERESRFYSSVLFALPGYVVTFVVLRWVIF